MTAGLPGTGIGGLYYVLLALWMPMRRSARGATSGSRSKEWGVAAKQFCIAVGMLASLSAEAWLLMRALFWIVRHTSAGTYWHDTAFRAWLALVPSSATWLTLVILGSVLLIPHALRVWLRFAPISRRDGMPASAAAHRKAV